VAEGVPRVLIGDAQRLQQILLNVLNNAVKFTETGGILLEVWVGPAPYPDAARRADAGAAAAPARPGAADAAAAGGAAQRAAAAEVAADAAALAEGTGGTVDTGAMRTQVGGGEGSDMLAGGHAPGAHGAGGHAPAERVEANGAGVGPEAGPRDPARGDPEPRDAAAAGAGAGACREGGCWGPCAMRIPDAGSAARDSGGSFAEWLGQPRAEAGLGSPGSLVQGAADPSALGGERGAEAAPCSPGRGGPPAGCAPAPGSPGNPEGPPAPGLRRSMEGASGGGRGGPDAGPLLEVHFSVRDTGIGISRADLDLLFRSFSQARVFSARPTPCPTYFTLPYPNLAGARRPARLEARSLQASMRLPSCDLLGTRAGRNPVMSAPPMFQPGGRRTAPLLVLLSVGRNARRWTRRRRGAMAAPAWAWPSARS